MAPCPVDIHHVYFSGSSLLASETIKAVNKPNHLLSPFLMFLRRQQPLEAIRKPPGNLKRWCKMM